MGDLLGVAGLKYLLLLCCMTFSVSTFFVSENDTNFPIFFLSKTKCLEKIQDITGSKKRGLNFMIFHEMKNLTLWYT